MDGMIGWKKNSGADLEHFRPVAKNQGEITPFQALWLYLS